MCLIWLTNVSERDGDNAVQWLFDRDAEDEAVDYDEQNNVIHMRNCPSCRRCAYSYMYLIHRTILISIDRAGSWSEGSMPRLRDLGVWGNGSLYVLILLAYLALAHISLRQVNVNSRLNLSQISRFLIGSLVKPESREFLELSPEQYDDSETPTIWYFESSAGWYPADLAV